MTRAAARLLRRLTVLASLAAPALATVGSAQTQFLRWVGCDLSRHAYAQELAKAFEAETGVSVFIDRGEATGGIREVAKLSADIGGSCRFSIEGERQEAAATLKPVAWDALVPIVHPSNPVNDITFHQLRAIYLGRITNWRALGGPDKPLVFFVRRKNISDVGHVTRRLLFDDPSLEFKARKYFASSTPLEKAVEKNPWSFAVTGASSARKRQVKILSLEGRRATYDSIRSGDYLLFLPLYVVTNAQNRKQPLVEQFVRFAYSSAGMAIIRRNGVVPYNDALHLVMKESEQLERARTR